MKKLDNIAGFPTLQDYAVAKLERYEKQEKNFSTLFEMMFSEQENIMAEITDGYRIKKQTYGQFRQWILEVAPAVRQALGEPANDSIVGIYMNNSMQWLVVFWSILMCGCRPLLMNTRLDDEILEQLLQEHSVEAVISDGKIFSVKTLLANDILVRGTPENAPEDFGSEVIFMSSGTGEQVKLCAYTGENFYYQVCASLDIIQKCPDIAEHYEGQLKQLVLLPLYHVFGFMAVYLWFGFFSRTFVFLRDLSPATLLNTIKKHKVTHIFAVPLVWESIYREAMRKIKDRGESTFSKFQTALKICNIAGAFGDTLAKRLLHEVRDGLFGDCVRFMISGGSHINPQIVAFFNGIGYPLVNGYGMTEVGITSVELSCKKKDRNKASIGQPFGHVSYQITPEKELLIKSNAMASRIVAGQTIQVTDYSAWFSSRDIAREDNGFYYLGGRGDDMIVCENGENINPVLTEPKLRVDGCREVCLFKSRQDGPVLLAYAPDCSNNDALQQLTDALRQALKNAKLADAVRKIVVTSTPLMESSEFKLSRGKIAKKYDAGKFFVLTPQNMEDHRQRVQSAMEIHLRQLFAEALSKNPEEIGTTDDFFNDLNGTSLDFFMLKDLIKQHYHIDIATEEQAPTTVQSCCRYITEQKR